MLKFIAEKLIQKKWMVLSLVIGGILMISMAVCNPMYINGALQNLLTTNLSNSFEETGIYPVSVNYNMGIKVSDSDWEDKNDIQIKGMDDKISHINIPIVLDISLLSVKKSSVFTKLNTEENNESIFFQPSNLSDLEEHINIITGKNYNKKVGKDGVYEAIVSKSAFYNLNLVLDEVITFDKLKDKDGNMIKIKIVGVFEPKDSEDAYWVMDQELLNTACFVSDSNFNKIANAIYFDKKSAGSVNMNRTVLYDYTKIDYKDIDQLLSIVKVLKEQNLTCTFADAFKEYKASNQKVVTTMNILQVPTMFLLAIFIYMVSSQMLAMESNEIAMLKSRGVSRRQIILIYLLQSSILSLFSMIVGVPIGYFMCKTLGVSNSFMEFVNRKSLPVEITVQTLIYALLATIFSILVMTLPVISMSKVTIVEHKQKSKNSKKLWKKIYLDVVLFLASLYGCYSFNNQRDSLIQKVLDGSSLDPILFLCSSVFILSCAMLAVRIIPVIIWLIYNMRKLKWSTATYTAFLQSIRTKDKQEFIMIFLVMTIAFGIFNANTARTINVNEEERIWTKNGADLVISEEWTTNQAAITYAKIQGTVLPDLVYSEPDFWKYDDIKDNINSLTKVYNEKDIEVTNVQDDETHKATTLLLGINTKEFGETAIMTKKINGKHWYTYLNLLAKDSKNVLVSENMRKDMNLKIGDTISYSRYTEIDEKTSSATGVIVGFVDSWPGYTPREDVKTEEGKLESVEQYLVVANYNQIYSQFGNIPYELWINNKAQSTYIYNFIADNKLRIVKFADSNNDIVKMKNDPVFQETNGMLTIGFIIVLTLCMVGFLIYWILSIRSRELIFGIYRAMGLSMKEIIKMLILEHLFSSVSSIVFGVGVGLVSSYLFIPLIEIAYSVGASNQSVVTWPIDMIRLAIIIIIMLVVCIYVISKLLSKMKISQALKLGEE